MNYDSLMSILGQIAPHTAKVLGEHEAKRPSEQTVILLAMLNERQLETNEKLEHVHTDLHTVSGKADLIINRP